MKQGELLIRIDERTAEMSKDITELKKKLFGNGEKGICERMDKIETEHITVDKIRQENRKTIGIILAAFSIIVSIIGYFKI